MQDSRIPRSHRRGGGAQRLPVRGITYNDPVIFLEYAVDVARACRERGVKTVAVSAGYIAPSRGASCFDTWTPQTSI